MPRGNDEEGQQSALHDLADDFGQGVGSAEDLILGNAAQREPDLVTVSSFPVDQEATNELDLDKLAEGDEYVLDAVVRRSGRSSGTIVVFEDEGGRAQKRLADSSLPERKGGQEDEEGTRRSTQAKSDDKGQEKAPAAKK